MIRRLAILFVLTVTALGCGGGKDDGAGLLNTQADVAFVGAAECSQCHLDVASTYMHTGMGRAWHRMAPEMIEADFTADNTFADPKTGVSYRMFERDGRYFMEQFLVDPNDGSQVARDERELIWAVGSNNHNRGYIVIEEGRFFQAPVCWYPNETLWDLCPGFEHDSAHFARQVRESCVFCHNGRMELAPGTHNAFVEPIPEGIGCESCHGPGELHVAKWSDGQREPDGSADPTIVNPRRLSRERRLDVCLQCHLGDSKATDRVGRVDVALNDFRPGRPLQDIIVPFHYVHQTPDEFGLSAQADRLILSACYQESEGRLECLTCHNPHSTVYAENRPADYFKRKCTGCHTVEDCSEEHGARSGTDGMPDDCVSCHMRVAEPDDQRHTTFTDHWIRRDITPTPEHDTRASLEIKPVFPEEYAQLEQAEQAYYAARANMLMSLSIPGERRAMWEAAEAGFREAIDKGWSDGRARFFLGKVLGYQEKDAEAEQAYRESLELSPGYDDAAIALGLLLEKRGAGADALNLLAAQAQRSPEHAGVLAEYGRFRLLAGQTAEAIELFDRAIALEPEVVTNYLNRGRARAASGQLETAAEDAAMATRLDPDSEESWDFYLKVMQARGDRAGVSQARRMMASLKDAAIRYRLQLRDQAHRGDSPPSGSAALAP
ncbi:hypothetical protein ABI59_13170 [Acidobacteria bacterium Mor1]|nr:hypothetical protein ABI59_13170 [Acidobacteria bacterium Mor1]